MIPITKPSINKSDYNFVKKALKSKILTDGFFQQQTSLHSLPLLENDRIPQYARNRASAAKARRKVERD